MFLRANYILYLDFIFFLEREMKVGLEEDYGKGYGAGGESRLKELCGMLVKASPQSQILGNGYPPDIQNNPTKPSEWLAFVLDMCRD